LPSERATTQHELHVVVGQDAGRTLSVSGRLVLGRDAGPGRLAGDSGISRRHAEVTAENGRLMIADLGSANGTRVNGTRLTGPRTLHNGDTIRVGATELSVSLTEVVEIEPDLTLLDQPRLRLGAAGAAILLHRGRRIALPVDGATIGSAKDSTVQINTALAAPQHARIDAVNDGYSLTDLGSESGTYVNGARIGGGSQPLSTGDTIMVGGETIRFLIGEPTHTIGRDRHEPIRGTRSIEFDVARLTLGRDPSNQVVLADPNVSRFHAEVAAVPGGYELRDLGSRNGTRLDGTVISGSSPIQLGSEIGVGPFRLIFDGETFLARDDRGLLRLRAEDLVVEVKGKRILDQATVAVEPGEFIAIIGESGAGKTTLIKAMAGVSAPTSGDVLVNGEPIASRLAEIGYVPQDEIVHRDLTVLEALGYAARLRLPQDSSRQEIDDAVQAAVGELALSEHARTRVGSLSGGQRKRAGVGTELVNRPGLLFLDEATTGLDPGLERRMMQLMRDLANNSRAVVTITHATRNLGLCDKLIVMGAGGHLCFFGSPGDALAFFEVGDYDGIYEALDTTPAREWRRRWEARSAGQRGTGAARSPAAPSSSSRPAARARTQAGILAARYIRLILRDRRNLLILLAQAPVLALLVASLFNGSVMRLGANHQSGTATQLVFLVVTVVTWLGSIDAAREIIKERAVFTRERAVGVRTSAYLVAKTLVLFTLATVQALILCAIVLALRHADASAGTYVEFILLVVVTSWAAVMMGLALSAFVNTENQAMSFIPMALIPQLLFAGQIKPLIQLPVVLRAVATLIFSRWSYAGLGGTLNFNRRFILDPTGRGQVVAYGHSFFALGTAPALGILALFIGAFMALVVVGLRRRSVHI
jgi:ABC-type multidrug transport system ATPase subunit/pSer/pThr/pTyr-binding forkhead associated (FHA) protein/ABC-type multidrug transport system permease subunit